MSEKPQKPSADKLKLRKATAKDLTVDADRSGNVKGGPCPNTRPGNPNAALRPN